MAQIIVSSRYLKSGKRGKTKRRNYTKYIATRESVENRPQNTGRTTDNQKQLISELIKEFPIVKQYLEYADYTNNPSSENASELISTIIERHADVTMSAYMLGKIYLKGDIVYRDFNKAEKYMRQASVDNEYAMYTLAKLYLTGERKNLSEAVRLLKKTCGYKNIQPYAAYAYAKIQLDYKEIQDTEKAIQLLKENSTGNNWCSCLLGKLYLFGNEDVEKNKAEAVKWLNMSAEAGNEYAQHLLENADNNSEMITSTITSLMINLCHIIEEDNRRSRKNISRADRKLLRIIQKKKQELGIKSDSVEPEYKC